MINWYCPAMTALTHDACEATPKSIDDRVAVSAMGGFVPGECVWFVPGTLRVEDFK